MYLEKQFIWKNNLEFVLSNWWEKIQKVLYRSFEKHQDFKENILQFFSVWVMLLDEEYKKLEEIFQLSYDDSQVFHFWVDEESGRYKFYISLYHTEFKKALKTISHIKKILWVQEKYFLEKEFLQFDCLGFDISNGKIHIKVYELVKKEDFLESLPEYISPESVKEVWYLKNIWGRKKLFYRFEDSVSIWVFQDDFETSYINELEKELWSLYFLQKKVRYYCIEGDKKEIYFV